MFISTTRLALRRIRARTSYRKNITLASSTYPNNSNFTRQWYRVFRQRLWLETQTHQKGHLVHHRASPIMATKHSNRLLTTDNTNRLRRPRVRVTAHIRHRQHILNNRWTDHFHLRRVLLSVRHTRLVTLTRYLATHRRHNIMFRTHRLLAKLRRTPPRVSLTQAPVRPVNQQYDRQRTAKGHLSLLPFTPQRVSIRSVTDHYRHVDQRNTS